MKKITEIFETLCVLNWFIEIILYGIDLVSSGKGYSPSNAVVVRLIVTGFVATQVMIRWGIENLKDELF